MISVLWINFAAEHPISIGSIRQDHWQQHERANEREHKTAVGGSRFDDRQGRRYDEWIKTDTDANETQNKQRLSAQERDNIPMPAQAMEKPEHCGRDQCRYQEAKDRSRECEPTIKIFDILKWRPQAEQTHEHQGGYGKGPCKVPHMGLDAAFELHVEPGRPQHRVPHR